MFDYTPHGRIEERKEESAVKTADQAVGISATLALKITSIVGTMACAAVFAVLALISLPAAIQSGNLIIMIGWMAQTFLQLVLLPIIIVGQNVQAAASDKRAEHTYLDVEAMLHEAGQIQEHLHIIEAAVIEKSAAK